MRSETELPPALRTLWRSVRFGYRDQPGLAVVAASLEILTSVADALFAWWLKLLADGAISGNSGMVLAAALGLAGSVVGSWLLQTLGARVQRTFRMRLSVTLEAHIAELQASIPTIEHHERPAYLDRLAVLRDDAWQLEYLYEELLSAVGALIRLGVVAALLATVHPAMLALVVLAIPTVAVSSLRAGAQQRATEAAAPDMRRARHLFQLGTTPGPAKEIRLAGIGDRLIAQRRIAWNAWNQHIATARWITAYWQAVAWLLFGLAYTFAVALAIGPLSATAGNTLLVIAAGSRLTQYIASTASSGSVLRWWLGAAQRLGWLERYATEQQDRADQTAPDQLQDGIRFENVSFRYPGTDTWVLRDISFRLPAGSVVAIVGDNGAGKSTLVKLLSRSYEPTHGRITVDGTDLSRIPAQAWRSRLAGAYQDFYNFELPAQHSIGIGDLDRRDDGGSVRVAVDKAGAADVIEGLPRGLESQLGATWHDGVELSFGQWQKIALARGLMRDRPLLLILDEPTAALDAETEHALFDRFAAQARTVQHHNGRITVVVSHRFSTVRMADLILVIQGTRLTEYGTHDDLLADDGTYAELYRTQARAYR